MELGLRGHVALISGGSRGIGLATAQAFVREGASVLITARGQESLQAAKEELAKDITKDTQVSVLVGDMTVATSAAAAVRHALDTFGRLDCVVANVGSGSYNKGYDLDMEQWRAAFDVNLIASVQLARSALDHFVRVRGGTLTFVSSIAGMESIDAPTPYAAAKAAIGAMAKSYARQVGRQGVRVNVVAPGNVLAAGGVWERKLNDNPDSVREYINREVPLGRLASPAEIANVIIYLSSPRASFVTGAIWIVDGGQTRAP